MPVNLVIENILHVPLCLTTLTFFCILISTKSQSLKFFTGPHPMYMSYVFQLSAFYREQANQCFYRTLELQDITVKSNWNRTLEY